MHTRTLLAGAAALLLPLLACSQGPQLKLPSLPDFKQPATETVDITLGAAGLHFAAALMDDDDSDSAGVKRTLEGLKSVQIRSFEFESDYACSQANLGPLRSQLSQPGWSRVVQTHERDEENVDMYVALEDQVVKGLAIITCQPRELTIVNVVGTIHLDQVARLRRTFAPGTTGTM
jgi:hypothetical protein